MSDELNLSNPGPVATSKNPLEKIADWAKSRYGEAIQKPIEFGKSLQGKALPEQIGQTAKYIAGEGAKDYAAEKYGAFNDLLLNAPDAIIKAVSKASKSDAYEKLKQFRKDRQLASDVGAGEGLAASFAVPGGTILGGASKGAKTIGLGKIAATLGKGAEIASGARKVGEGAGMLGRVGGAALKGGLLGAEQAVPRGITTAIGEGDIGQGAKEAAIGTLGGAALGGGLGLAGEALKGAGKLGRGIAESSGLIRKSGDVTDPIKKNLMKMQLKSILPDLKSSDFKRALNQSARKLGVDKTGLAINSAEDLQKATLDLVKDTGLRNPDDIKEFIQGTGKVFENAYNKLESQGITPAQIVAPALETSSDDIAEFIAKHPEGAQYIKDIQGKLGGTDSIRGAKAILDDEARFLTKNAGSSRMSFDAEPIIRGLKDKLDEAVMEASPELAKAKETWRVIQPLRQMIARDEASIGSVFGTGSPTAEKAAIGKALGAFSGGASSVGALIGGVPGMIAGSIGGQALSKGLPKVSNYLAGELAGKLNNPATLEAIQKGLGAVKGIAGKIGEYAPKIAGLAPKVAGAAPSILGREEVQAEIAPKEEADKAIQDVQATESAVAPDKIEEAKQETNSKWADRVNQNIGQAFYLYGLDQMGISLEEFQDAVRQDTNDFDPKLSAKIVFDDDKERAAFLKDYDRALQYKAINVSEALTPSGFFGPSGEQKGSKEQLRGWLANIAGQDPMLMDDKKKKAIDSTIDRVSKMKGTQAEKQSALLRELQTNYGIDFARLADLGLLGVA